MGKLEHAPNRKQSPNRKKPEPGLRRPPSPEPAEPAGLGEAYAGQADAASTQAALLDDGRLPAMQRRALASQIGRAQGNRRLQGIIAAAQQSGPPWGTLAGPVVQAQVPPPAPKAPAGPKTTLDELRDKLNATPVDKAASLALISQLGPDAALARKDDALLAKMAGAFDGKQMMEVVQRLGLDLRFSVYWINRAGKIPEIGNKGLDLLISGASALDVAQLIGWPAMMNVVKANYAGVNPLTVFPTLVGDDTQLAHVFATYGHYVDWILDGAGPQLFLRFLVAHSPKKMIDALVTGNRWAPFLAKLPKGVALMPADKSALYDLAYSTSDFARQEELFDVRFDLQTAKAGYIDWETKGLQRAWQILNILPVPDVEGNPKMKFFLRAAAGETAGESDMSTYVAYWYRANKMKQKDIGAYTNPKDAMYGMNIFDGTIIHEIGHAVDGARKLSDAYCKTADGGGWVKQTPATAVDGMVAASPWPTTKAWTAALKGQARQACINAVTNSTSVAAEAHALDPKGGLWKTIRSQRVVRAIPPAQEARAPWMHHEQQFKFADRYYHEGYRGEWHSYLSARYDAKISKYQFRDPTDWFAEVYALYYLTVNPSSPKAEDAGKKVPEPIRTWFRDNVAKTTPPPGAAKAGPKVK